MQISSLVVPFSEALAEVLVTLLLAIVLTAPLIRSFTWQQLAAFLHLLKECLLTIAAGEVDLHFAPTQHARLHLIHSVLCILYGAEVHQSSTLHLVQDAVADFAITLEVHEQNLLRASLRQTVQPYAARRHALSKPKLQNNDYFSFTTINFIINLKFYRYSRGASCFRNGFAHDSKS